MQKRKPAKRSKLKQTRQYSKRQSTTPQTADEFFALSESLQELYLLDLELVGLVRAGLSKTKARKQLRLTRSQADRFTKGAFTKRKNGRYVAKAYDNLLRVVTVISEDGLREVATRDSRQASRAGKHSAAVSRYLQTGDALPLAPFKDGYIVDAKGERVPLLTDLEELDEMGSAGVLSFESLYARSL